MYNGEIGHKYSAFNQLWFFNFQISTTKETFQDLSLPIPSKDHLYVLHSNAQGSPIKGGACGEAHQTWMTWILTLIQLKFYMNPTKNLIELKLYINPTKI